MPDHHKSLDAALAKTTAAHSADYDAGRPSDGHTFRFRFDIRPSSKVVGDPDYADGPTFMGPVHEIQVRAWSLTAALRKAADLPFGVLMGNLVSDEPLPAAAYRCGCGHDWHLHDLEAVPSLCMVCGDAERCVFPSAVGDR